MVRDRRLLVSMAASVSGRRLHVATPGKLRALRTNQCESPHTGSTLWGSVETTGFSAAALRADGIGQQLERAHREGAHVGLPVGAAGAHGERALARTDDADA